jgi:hypothetical protein
METYNDGDVFPDWKFLRDIDSRKDWHGIWLDQLRQFVTELTTKEKSPVEDKGAIRVSGCVCDRFTVNALAALVH